MMDLVTIRCRSAEACFVGPTPIFVTFGNLGTARGEHILGTTVFGVLEDGL
jgi:hypothetical protein